VAGQAIAGESKPARKQQQRSIVTQQKLLDAAIDAFSENGFKGTSTRDIADRAGVHHPLITYHFKNKDQLWRAAADRIFREFNISLVKAMTEIPEIDAKARAEAFIRTYVRYENHLRPLFEEVVKSLSELQRLGIAPPGDPALLFNMIRVSAGGLLALAVEIKGTSNLDFNSQQALDDLSDMIIRCFLPGELSTSG
jgi:AcrR family transcriptional regulator